MRILRIAALLVIAALVAAACGSPPSAGGDSAIDLIAAAGSNTNDVGTAKVEMDMAIDAGGQSLSMTASGAMDLDTKLARMTVRMSSADARFPDLGDIEMVMDGFKVYTKYPPEIARSLTGDKPWALIDAEEMSKAQGVDLGALAQTSGSDPTQVLQYLNGVSGDVETVGEEEVRGVATTHYRATIDLSKVADQAPEDVREAVRLSIKAMEEQLGKSKLPIEVWIGEDRLVHRMVMSQTGEGPEGPFSMDVTMELYDFGEPVEVVIPPSSQVADITEKIMRASAGSTP